MISRRVVNILAASATCVGLTVTGAVSAAGPPETAQLTPVPSTWRSQPPAAHLATGVTDVISFGTESWVVATITNRLVVETSAVVQHCVMAGCTAQFLPGLPDTDGPKAHGVAGTSRTDLWAFGAWRSAPNTSSPLIWRNVTGAWRLFPTRGIVGDAAVVDMTFGPSGGTWATVIEDFDASTWVLYRLKGSRWVQVNTIDAPVFPGPCRVDSEAWYEIIWADMEVVGGQPTLIGACREPVILTRQGTAWRRIDKGLPTNAKWSNAAVVDKQLWVQGTLSDGSIIIYRRASGTWRRVSTAGIATNARINDMAGTVAKNVWLVGETGPSPGTPDAASWRWTGSNWRRVPPVATSAAADWFRAVDSRGYKPAWVVGTDSGRAPSQMARVLREN